MTFKFIHTADWQLGKPFGGFENDLAGELKAARRDVIRAVAEIARKQSAQHVIVAGDVWDSEFPSPGAIRQPLDLMGETSDICWWLMPGNHDLHRQGGLWSRVSKLAPDNVRLLLTPEPVKAVPGVYLLPSPWTSKFPAEDLTAWMDSAHTPSGTIRIGIGHGGYKSFGGDAAEIIKIDEDRVSKAKLDYLALGDWHGKLQINDQAWYAGTPEPDRFVNNDRGFVLCVEIESSGATPIVTPIKSARFEWPLLECDLRSSEEVRALQSTILGDRSGAATLLQLTLTGSLSLTDRAALDSELETLRARVRFLDVRSNQLQTRVNPDDLDTLDAQGSVRKAAEQLQEMMEEGGPKGDAAKHALSLLFTYAHEASKENL